MSEFLETYDLNGNFEGIEDRKEFYAKAHQEFNETGIVSKKVKTVRALIMNSLGRIYLQKRSALKEENSGLYDKTIGGHVTAGNTFDLTAVKECAEELGFPATILTHNDFSSAIKTVDLQIIGVLRNVDHIENYESTRTLKDGGIFVQPYITDIYIGYYDGAIRFVDGESSGVETFSVDELKQEIQAKPEKFTTDLKFMIEKYSEQLIAIKG